MDNNISVILKCQKQDKDAFGKLVKTYSRWLLGLTASLSSYQEAEDIAQDIWVIVWKHIAGLKDPLKFKAWLRMIAIREITRRRKVISIVDSSRSSIDEQNELPANEEGQEIQIHKKETFDNLCKKLSIEQKDTLVLYAIEGLTINEVSELLNVPKGTIKSRINKIRSIAKDQQ